MALEVGAVVIDCNDLKRMAEFWGAVLGYQVREPADEFWITLEDASDSRVSVSLQKVPEPRSGKNRIHLDLYTDDK
jgi:catechol-2,3-dioxygenase